MKLAMMYDLCIVGSGMIGSAAARHATLSPGISVCLIGPSEPKDRTSDPDRDIYGAWYDKGRITRCCDPDPVWAKLALESIKRYRNIEMLSGIQFYDEVGCVMFGTGTDSDYITSLKVVANDYKVKTELVTGEKYSYLKLPDDTHGVRESTNAGVINPRKLIQAQQRLASEQGCTLIDDVVHKCERIVKSNGEYAMLIKTEGGKTVNAKSVLLCTGAFGKFRDVLPNNVSTKHKISPVTVVLMEVKEQCIDILRDMPCMIYKGQRHNDWICPAEIRPEDDIDFYMLPPIKYPDGRTYIKLGMTDAHRGHLETSVDVKHWFNVGNPTFQEHIATFTKSICNGIHFLSWKGDSCVIMDTPTNRPYIDKVHDQLGVAIGCNGYAAKSSDEIGRLAVNMIQGEWKSDLKQDLFKIRIEHCSKL